MVMVDRLPLFRRRSPGRRRGLLSLPFFCRIEGKVCAKFPKFKKSLWVFCFSIVPAFQVGLKKKNLFMYMRSNSRHCSSVAQWQSGRLLTDWSQVQVLPGEIHIFSEFPALMLGVGKIFLVIVYIDANPPKRDKNVLTLSRNGNNGLFKRLKRKILKS